MRKIYAFSSLVPWSLPVPMEVQQSLLLFLFFFSSFSFSSSSSLFIYIHIHTHVVQNLCDVFYAKLISFPAWKGEFFLLLFFIIIFYKFINVYLCLLLFIKGMKFCMSKRYITTKWIFLQSWYELQTRSKLMALLGNRNFYSLLYCNI